MRGIRKSNKEENRKSRYFDTNKEPIVALRSYDLISKLDLSLKMYRSWSYQYYPVFYHNNSLLHSLAAAAIAAIIADTVKITSNPASRILEKKPFLPSPSSLVAPVSRLPEKPCIVEELTPMSILLEQVRALLSFG